MEFFDICGNHFCENFGLFLICKLFISKNTFKQRYRSVWLIVNIFVWGNNSSHSIYSFCNHSIFLKFPSHRFIDASRSSATFFVNHTNYAVSCWKWLAKTSISYSYTDEPMWGKLLSDKNYWKTFKYKHCLKELLFQKYIWYIIDCYENTNDKKTQSTQF